MGLLIIGTQKHLFKQALGGFSGSAPISPEINGTSYDIDNSTSWIGMFINHRPFADADWFRLGTGIGVGTIKNTLSSEGSDDLYQADYEGNIVGYVGVGFGGQPKKRLSVKFRSWPSFYRWCQCYRT